MPFTGVLKKYLAFLNLQQSTCSSHNSMWHYPKAQDHAKRRNSQAMVIPVSSLTSQERIWAYMQLQSTAATRVTLFKAAVLLHVMYFCLWCRHSSWHDYSSSARGKYLMPYCSCHLSCLFIEDGNSWELLVGIMIVRCIQSYPFIFSELYCPFLCCTLSTSAVEMWCELQEAPQIRKYQLYIIWPLVVALFLIQVFIV